MLLQARIKKIKALIVDVDGVLTDGKIIFDDAGKETKNEEKRKRTEQFIGNFTVIPLTPSLAKIAGELRRDYEKPFADMIVAASALEYGLGLVTRNIKDFQTLEKRAGLKMLNPY